MELSFSQRTLNNRIILPNAIVAEIMAQGVKAISKRLLAMRSVFRTQSKRDAQPWVRVVELQLSPVDETQAHTWLVQLELQPFRRPRIYGVIDTVAGSCSQSVREYQQPLTLSQNQRLASRTLRVPLNPKSSFPSGLSATAIGRTR